MTLAVDVHEPKKMDIELDNLGIETERKALNVGDYGFADYRIERKTVKDFLNSIYHKRRIYNQLYNLQQAEHPVLIVSGEVPPKEQWIHSGNRKFPRDLTYEEQQKRYKTIRKNIIIAYTSYGVQVFQAQDDDDLVKYIAELYFSSTKKGTCLRKLSKKSKSLKNIKIDMFGSIPNIGAKTAHRLTKNYNVREIVMMSEDELCEIKGIGPKTADKILECVSN